MTLKPLSSLESARKKFLMNSTQKAEMHIMSRKWESNAFWAQEAEMTLTPLSSLESARKKFLIDSTYIMSRRWESNVFGLRRPK